MQTFYFEAGTGRCLGSFGAGTLANITLASWSLRVKVSIRY